MRTTWRAAAIHKPRPSCRSPILWVDGLGRHSAPRRPSASSHARLFGGAQEQLASAWQYHPCGQIIDATLVLTPKQPFTKEEKDIVERSTTWSPTKRRQKDLWTPPRGQALLSPPHDRPALRPGTGPDEHEPGGLWWYGLCSLRTRALREAGYRQRLQRKATRALQRITG
jgi:hypothetical protein